MPVMTMRGAEEIICEPYPRAKRAPTPFSLFDSRKQGRPLSVHNHSPHVATFVWLGGALFVASLVDCAWWYIRRLGDPSAAGGWRAALFDAALLTAFALHHSVFARQPVKARLTRVISGNLERSVYVWIASLLLILVITLWRRIGGTVYRSDGWLAIVHAAIQLLGVWLIARSVAGIDALELAGIRRQSTPGELQTAGPYRLGTSPMYAGWVIAVFGAAHMTGDRLVFATITTAYLAIAVRWEERSLVKSFGEEDRRYQRRVTLANRALRILKFRRPVNSSVPRQPLELIEIHVAAGQHARPRSSPPAA